MSVTRPNTGEKVSESCLRLPAGEVRTPRDSALSGYHTVGCSYGRNVCAPLSSYAEALTPNVTGFGDRTLGSN